MKKLFCALAALTVLLTSLSLAACNKNDNAEATTAPTTTEPESLPVGTFEGGQTTTEPASASVSSTANAAVTTLRAVVTTTRAAATTTRAAATTTRAAATTTRAAATTTGAAVTTSSVPSTTAVVHNGILSQFTAKDINGNEVNQEIFKGKKLTMVNIWGTFCSPCIQEMPALGEISSEYASKGVQLIGIVSDATNRNAIADARDIVEATGANYVHLVPSDTLDSAVLDSVQYVPTTFFVDENGNQVGGAIVGSKTKSEWASTIDAVLAGM